MSERATLYVVCKRCGHEREVARDDLRGGDWRHKHCPACEPIETDVPDNERPDEPDAA